MKYYIGKDGLHQTDSSLQHWKYIRREKLPNGKWRYIYDKEKLKDDLGFDERAAYRNAHNDVVTGKAKIRYEERRVAKTSPAFGSKSEKQQAEYNETKKDLTRAQTEYKMAVRDYNNKKETYYKTPIGKVSKAVDKGKDLIEKLFKKDIWKDFNKRL